MRAVFVNYCHPDTPHVCGARVPSFARAMAQRSNQIVLVTKTLRDDEAPIGTDLLAKALAQHDWREPFHLACPPVSDPWLSRVRRGGVPTPIRKMVIALYYLKMRGLFSDWVEGSRPYWGLLANTFRPQVVWGAFGNSDTWRLAQGVARLAGCPWVGDLKDGWDRFIPFPLRRWLAGTFRDAASFTANSRFFADGCPRRFGRMAAVVYSGVSDCFLLSEGRARKSDHTFRITLTGSLYDDGVLGRFLEGLAGWCEGRIKEKPAAAVELVYAGSDSDRLKRRLGCLDGCCRATIHDYLPLPEFAELCRGANINAYMRFHGTFHHKLLELLSCGKTVLAVPAESEEAIALARACGEKLLVASTAEEVSRALDMACQPQTPEPITRAPGARQFSWAAQSLTLEKVLDAYGGSHA